MHPLVGLQAALDMILTGKPTVDMPPTSQRGHNAVLLERANCDRTYPVLRVVRLANNAWKDSTP